MIKQGFTILEATFSIMILSVVISFGVYLSSKSFESYNKFSLMNLAYMEHENRLNLALNLIKTNQLKFKNNFETCKLTSLNTAQFTDCVNLENFQILNNLEIKILPNLNKASMSPLFCQDEDCNVYDFKTSEFASKPIFTYLKTLDEAGEKILEIQTDYEFKNIEYKINTKLKL